MAALPGTVARSYVCAELSSSVRPSSQALAHAKGRSTSSVLRRESAFVSTGARRMNDGKDQLRCFARWFIPHAASASQETGRPWSGLGERSSHAIPAARRCKLRPSSVCEARSNKRYRRAERYGAGVAVTRRLIAAIAAIKQIVQESKRQTWGGPRIGAVR